MNTHHFSDSKNLDASKKDHYELTRPVFFIGFMGAGKSSVARKLARKCGIASVDMDKYIERKARKTIPEIFAESGENGFRELETDVLRELSEDVYPMLISCGGGIVVKSENIEILKQRGFVVHLVVDVDEASRRISDKSSRPLFSDLESARSRLEERRPMYESAADVSVITDGKSVYEIASEIQSLLEQEGVLCQPRRS